uniref:Putative ovule protein n=1 Tax=Solanum chacoense TaxID=4108 RepID=A0A0V0HBW7_SOLCH
MTILPFSVAFSFLVCISGMIDVVPDSIMCAFGDLTPFELRFHDRVDLGQHFELRASDGNFISYIASKTSSLS